MRHLLHSKPEEAAPLRVVVVGGGAAGVITATHLLRAADRAHPVDVRIIGRGSVLGPGLAYRTSHPVHTLNNYAGRLSAIEGDPDHLLRWCAARGEQADPTSFLRRDLYGAYLAGVLDDTPVPAGSALRRTRGVVTDVLPDGRELTVRVSRGWSVPADHVVLALGNPPPGRRPELEHLGQGYVADPWAPDLVDRVGSAKEVLLLGTGLTMVDVAAQLHQACPDTRFTAVSRRGLLPQAHKRSSQRLHDIFKPGTASLEGVVARVEARVRELEETGGDWRDVIDSVRAGANEVWQGFSPAEQERFVETVGRRWETVRHRMAPDMATRIESLTGSGALRVARVDEVDLTRFDRAVNCTGPAPVPTRGWNRLVDALLDRGAIRPHRLGLGLDLDPDGRVIDGSGRVDPHLHAVGAARRGIEWEVAAIPDLRTQASRLADGLVRPMSTAATGAALPAAQ